MGGSDYQVVHAFDEDQLRKIIRLLKESGWKCRGTIKETTMIADGREVPFYQQEMVRESE